MKESRREGVRVMKGEREGSMNEVKGKKEKGGKETEEEDSEG